MMQQVNLLVEELRPKREFLTVRQVAFAWCAFAALLGLLSAWDWLQLRGEKQELTLRASQVQMLQQANARLQSSIASAPEPELQAAVSDLRQLQASQELLVTAIRGYERNAKHGFAPYLRDLARQHVDGMWLEQIGIEQGGARIELSGQTVDPVHVPVFLKRLSLAGSFAGHSFDALELEEVGAGVLRFDITGPREERGG